jgi:hypothetical protein
MVRIRGDLRFIQLWLSADDTYGWAHRPGERWPCFTLAHHRDHLNRNEDGVYLWCDYCQRRKELL